MDFTATDATTGTADGSFGVMVASRGTEMVPVPLSEACASVRGVPIELYDVAETFFG